MKHKKTIDSGSTVKTFIDHKPKVDDYLTLQTQELSFSIIDPQCWHLGISFNDLLICTSFILEFLHFILIKPNC